MKLPAHHTELAAILGAHPQIAFSVLVGSRATGTARADSDWDIALSWLPGKDWLATLGEAESLRRRIATALHLPASSIDLIDLARANLAMRASAAEEGLPLSGEDSAHWARFLRRTWRELEDFCWERAHAR